MSTRRTAKAVAPATAHGYNHWAWPQTHPLSARLGLPHSGGSCPRRWRSSGRYLALSGGGKLCSGREENATSSLSTARTISGHAAGHATQPLSWRQGLAAAWPAMALAARRRTGQLRCIARRQRGCGRHPSRAWRRRSRHRSGPTARYSLGLRSGGVARAGASGPSCRGNRHASRRRGPISRPAGLFLSKLWIISASCAWFGFVGWRPQGDHERNMHASVSGDTWRTLDL